MKEKTDSIKFCSLYFCTDGNGRFWWEDETGEISDITRPFFFKFRRNKSLIRNTESINNIPKKFTEELNLNDIKYLQFDESKTFFNRSDLRNLGSFIEKHCSWWRKYLECEKVQDIFIIMSEIYCVDNFNFCESVSKRNHVQNTYFLYPLLVAHCLTMPALSSVDPLLAVDNGDEFYKFKSMGVPPLSKLVYSQDIKELCINTFGVYTKKLGRFFSDVIFDDVFFTKNELTIFSLLYGLPSQFLEEYVTSLKFEEETILRGIPLVLDDDFIPVSVYIPEWFSSRSNKRKISFIEESLPLLLECFRVSCRMEEEGKIFDSLNNTSNLYEVHKKLMELDATVDKEDEFKSDTNRYAFLDNSEDIFDVEGSNFIVQNICDPASLCFIGSFLGVCVGETSYIERLKNGDSLFFALKEKGRENIFHGIAEYSIDGKKVDMKGSENSNLDIEDGFSRSIEENFFGIDFQKNEKEGNNLAIFFNMQT